MLHTVNASPYSSHALAQCLRYARPKSTILLMEDAVIAAIEKGLWEKTLLDSGHFIYLLRDDVIARGFEGKISSKINCVDMQGFVTLTEQHSGHLKW